MARHIRDAGNLLLSTSQHDFPVVHGDQVIGLLSRSRPDAGHDEPGSRRLRGPARHGPRLHAHCRRMPSFPKCSRSFPASGAAALVMDDAARLLGMLTAENLSDFLLLRQVSLAHEHLAK